MLRDWIARARMAWLLLVFLVLTLVMCLFWLVMAPFTTLLGDRDRHFGHFLSVSWARAIVALQPWWSVSVTGRENLAPRGTGVIYAANHQHESDILMLFQIRTRFRWLSKMSLFHIPLLGWSMWITGYVGVRRGSHESHLAAKRKSAEFLRRGVPMLYFPEGTFGDGKSLQFKQGAFRLAQEEGVPVIPITIRGTRDLLRGMKVFPARVEIAIHERIENEGASAVELATRTREVMEPALGFTSAETAGSAPTATCE